MGYRLSYRVSIAPSKAQDDLAPDEGLTDHVVFVSIIGTPGAPEPLSMSATRLEPSGAIPLTGAFAYHLTAYFAEVARQTVFDPDLHRAIEAAQEALQKPFRGHSGKATWTAPEVD